VDAPLIGAPSSAKIKVVERDPVMPWVKLGNQCYFGMNAHIGVDVDYGLGHTVIRTIDLEGKGLLATILP